MSKQKVSTTKIDGFWDYEGEYKGYEFVVRKNRDGVWEGDVPDLAGVFVEADKKREVVNKLVGEINDTDGIEEEKDYQEEIFDGVPIFSVSLTKERDYSYQERKTVTNEIDISEFLSPYFQDKDREVLVLVLMDTGNSIIGIHELAVGGIDSSIVDIRNIMKVTLLANATKIALAHNHPSGNSEPSYEDIQITKRIKKAAETMKIKFLDHVVFGDQTTSLRERGILN